MKKLGSICRVAPAILIWIGCFLIFSGWWQVASSKGVLLQLCHLLLEFKDCTQGVSCFFSCDVIGFLLQHQLPKAGAGEDGGHEQDRSIEQSAEYVDGEKVVRPVEPRRLHHLPHQLSVIKKPLDRFDITHDS